MLAFYALYSVHAASYYDAFMGRGGAAAVGSGIEGHKAGDLEASAPSASGPSAAEGLRRALSRNSTFGNPFTGEADLRREIGRASGAVAVLPPATLPPLP